MSATWAETGYWEGRNRVIRLLRLLWQQIRPPRGHRTIPTKTGILLIALTIGIGTAAFNTTQNILYIALSFLLSALVLSGLLSWVNLHGCRWSLNSADRWRVGQHEIIELVCINNKKSTPTWSLGFDVKTEISGEKRTLELERILAAGETRHMRWDYIPQKRGRERIYLERLHSDYPFGFLRKSIRESLSLGVRIWPARIAYSCNWNTGGRWQRIGPGTPVAGEGVDLRRLRAYQSGDPLRQIHWKATARTGKLTVRETEEPTEATLYLDLSVEAKIWHEPDLVEVLCALAGTVAEDLLLKGESSHWVAHDGTQHPLLKRSDLLILLDYLADLTPSVQPAAARQAGAAQCIHFLPGRGNRVEIYQGDRHVGSSI